MARNMAESAGVWSYMNGHRKLYDASDIHGWVQLRFELPVPYRILDT
jgi:hypothetical protein